MRVQIYGTMAADKTVTNDTTLLLREGATATPAHPDGGSWSYVATMDTDGADAGTLTRTALRAIELQGFYMRSVADDE
jgi:hypothetical protein